MRCEECASLAYSTMVWVLGVCLAFVSSMIVMIDRPLVLSRTRRQRFAAVAVVLGMSCEIVQVCKPYR